MGRREVASVLLVGGRCAKHGSIFTRTDGICGRCEREQQDAADVAARASIETRLPYKDDRVRAELEFQRRIIIERLFKGRADWYWVAFERGL